MSIILDDTRWPMVYGQEFPIQLLPQTKVPQAMCSPSITNSPLNVLFIVCPCKIAGTLLSRGTFVQESWPISQHVYIIKWYYVTYQTTCQYYQMTYPYYQTTCPYIQTTCQYYQTTCQYYQTTCPYIQTTCQYYQTTCQYHQTTLCGSPVRRFASREVTWITASSWSSTSTSESGNRGKRTLNITWKKN